MVLERKRKEKNSYLTPPLNRYLTRLKFQFNSIQNYSTFQKEKKNNSRPIDENRNFFLVASTRKSGFRIDFGFFLGWGRGVGEGSFGEKRIKSLFWFVLVLADGIGS